MLKGNKLHFYRMSSCKVLKAGSEGQFGGKENNKEKKAKLLLCICRG